MILQRQLWLGRGWRKSTGTQSKHLQRSTKASTFPAMCHNVQRPRNMTNLTRHNPPDGPDESLDLSHGSLHRTTSSSHNSSIFPLELPTTQNQLIGFECRALHSLARQSLIMKYWTHGALVKRQFISSVHPFAPKFNESEEKPLLC